MIRRPPRSTLSSSSAASDVYKRQVGDEREERLRALGRRRDVETAHAHGAAGGHDDAGNAAKRGRLAGAIGADEAEHFAGGDRERQPSHGLEVAVAFGEPLDVDHEIGGAEGGMIERDDTGADMVNPNLNDWRAS